MIVFLGNKVYICIERIVLSLVQRKTEYCNLLVSKSLPT